MLVLGVIFVAGCATRTAAPQANVNLSGFPPAFREGYADGCASAHGAIARDDSRFITDPHYATGWRDGRSICRQR